MSQRIQVSDQYQVALDGQAWFSIMDVQDGTVLAKHSFALGGEEVIRTHKAVAQAIAWAMNAAPRGAIELIRTAGFQAGQAETRFARRRPLAA